MAKDNSGERKEIELNISAEPTQGVIADLRNGVISNAAVLFVVALGFILAVVAIPLQILGGS